MPPTPTHKRPPSSPAPPSSSDTTTAANTGIIMFQSFASCAQVSFWQELAKLKIDVLGLDQKPLDITGTYAIAPPTSKAATATAEVLPSRVNVGIESLSSLQQKQVQAQPQAHTHTSSTSSSLIKECRIPGVIQNFNTDEAFRAFDKSGWLQSLGEKIWEEIQDGTAVSDPGRLARFAILCFADIKRNAFIYWFAFPAVVSAPAFKYVNGGGPVPLVGGFFSEAECLLLHGGFQAFRRARWEQTGDASCPPFFLLLRSLTTTQGVTGASSSSLSLEVAPLEAYEQLDEPNKSQVIFGFVDPGTVPLAPGWPLRNFLLLLANRWKLKEATVLCYRGRVTSLAAPGSSEGGGGSNMRISPTEAAKAMGGSFVIHASLSPLSSSSSPPSLITKGWELHKGKYMPRRIDLSAMMDPTRLAESSVDLNLKLMRWRLLPALNIPLLAQTKCLLLGAGTLGCSVARCLLGWGVRTITFVDNGRVALSNPVRQSLFEYTDCENGGKFKAEAAAKALKRIFPGVHAEGYVMTIPMPGHPLSSESEQASAEVDVKKLDALVQEHDVVFLLTDTRESRWLPTVLAAAHDKLLLNTALGFDTFMVMRHGAQPSPSDTHTHTQPPATKTAAKIEERIGCYFCNDVVAPEDSTKDRTLDQQCTVTRPGLAPMASALAVELMVALLHHPHRHRAPADCPEEDRKGGSGGGGGGSGGNGPGLGQRFDEDVDRPLGILPQQIRGFLAHFTTILPVTRAFKHCTGCAPAVVEGYKERGFDLVRQACNEHVFLEELTGLAQMRREADEMEMLWMDEEEEEEEEGEEETEEGEGEELELDLGKATLSTAAPASTDAGDGVDGGGGVEEAKETKPEEAKAEEM